MCIAERELLQLKQNLTKNVDVLNLKLNTGSANSDIMTVEGAGWWEMGNPKLSSPSCYDAQTQSVL